MNSITRKLAEEKLIGYGLHPKYINRLLNVLFPPSFVPKEGEVIAVRNNTSGYYRYREFYKMESGRYMCFNENKARIVDTGEKCNCWIDARPQTDKEKG